METVQAIVTKTKEGYYKGGIEIRHKTVGVLWRQYSESQRLTINDAKDDAHYMRIDLLCEKK